MLGLAIVCFAKGRVVLGVIGLFIPLVALVAALRLARPASPWAQWRYHGERLERSRRRFADDRPLVRARRTIGDAVAGAPTSVSEAR